MAVCLKSLKQISLQNSYIVIIIEKKKIKKNASSIFKSRVLIFI
jgi:hypothetical protein